MGLKIPRLLVEFILLGPEDDRRQLQDSPILGDVWVEFARQPKQRLELLITPNKEQDAAKAAAELHRSVPGGREPENRTDVAYLGAGGLVVPRAVLARTQGFDARYDPRGCAGLDLSFQIREAGYVLALSPDIGILRPDPASAVTSEAGVMHEQNRRRLLAKWRRRPEYFAAPDAAAASRDLV